MNASSKKTPCCSLCGASRKPSELNGALLAKGGWNFSSAYCSRLSQCDSKEAEAQIYGVLQDMSFGSEKAEETSITSQQDLIPISLSKEEFTSVIIQRLEVIQSQVEDEKISVRKHFSIVSKAMGHIEIYQDLFGSLPESITCLSNCISESYFS